MIKKNYKIIANNSLIPCTIYFTSFQTFYPFLTYISFNEVHSESEYPNFQMYMVDAEWHEQSLYTEC